MNTPRTAVTQHTPRRAPPATPQAQKAHPQANPRECQPTQMPLNPKISPRHLKTRALEAKARGLSVTLILKGIITY